LNSRRPLTTLLLVVALVLAALRPMAPVDRLLDGLAVPTRWVVGLSAPLRWIESSRTSAADAEALERRDAEGFAGALLALDLRAAAEPSTPANRLGRRMVPGHVSGRVVGRRDSVWVAFDPRLGTLGVPVGAPVVVGEAYLGRVAALEPERGRARVDLVTGRAFYVGGVHETGGLRMTVGGLHGTSGAPKLAVHNPSERRFRSGLVRVLEPELLSDEVAHLADGYVLGELSEEAEGAWAVEPVVNFKSGLFQVTVLVPVSSPRPPEPDPIATLADGDWLATQAVTAGDSFRGRRTLRLGIGAWQGVEPGAAVVAVTRLIGRVDPLHPAAPMSARVRLLGDPGLELHVMARLDHDASAQVLGRFVGLGVDTDGTPLFEWESPLGLPGQARDSVEATLYTGSGLVGLPDGLYLGRATLPCEPGAHGIRLTDFADGLEHARLWVRARTGVGEAR